MSLERVHTLSQPSFIITTKKDFWGLVSSIVYKPQRFYYSLSVSTNI